MWIFEWIVAEKRKKYDFLVKLLEVDGFAGASRRKGKIVKTEAPEQYPLSQGLPATVEIEYTDNHSNTCRQRVPVCNLKAQDPKNGCTMIITTGDRQGLIVKHTKTIGNTVKLRVEGEKRLLQLPMDKVCPVVE